MREIEKKVEQLSELLRKKGYPDGRFKSNYYTYGEFASVYLRCFGPAENRKPFRVNILLAVNTPDCGKPQRLCHMRVDYKLDRSLEVSSFLLLHNDGESDRSNHQRIIPLKSNEEIPNFNELLTIRINGRYIENGVELVDHEYKRSKHEKFRINL